MTSFFHNRAPMHPHATTVNQPLRPSEALASLVGGTWVAMPKGAEKPEAYCQTLMGDSHANDALHIFNQLSDLGLYPSKVSTEGNGVNTIAQSTITVEAAAILKFIKKVETSQDHGRHH
jgi:hypothetical protein